MRNVYDKHKHRSTTTSDTNNTQRQQVAKNPPQSFESPSKVFRCHAHTNSPKFSILPSANPSSSPSHQTDLVCGGHHEVFATLLTHHSPIQSYTALYSSYIRIYLDIFPNFQYYEYGANMRPKNGHILGPKSFPKIIIVATCQLVCYQGFPPPKKIQNSKNH